MEMLVLHTYVKFQFYSEWVLCALESLIGLNIHLMQIYTYMKACIRRRFMTAYQYSLTVRALHVALKPQFFTYPDKWQFYV
jgi:hypothetical protein